MFYFLLLLLSTLLGLTNSAYAATYWVSKTGSDSNACSAIDGSSDPGVYRATWSGGNGCAGSGDTVRFKSGTYTGAMTTKSGVRYEVNPGDTVALIPPSGFEGISVGTSGVTVSGTGGTLILDASNVYYGVGISTNNNRFENFEIKNSQGMGLAGPGSFNELINLHVHHNGSDPGCSQEPVTGPCHGVYMDGTNILIDGGSWHDNQDHGIHLYPGGSNSTIRNIRVFNNGTGIGVYSGSGTKVYNNVVYNNASQGIRAGHSNSLYANNTLYGNGIGLNGTSSSLTIRNNIAYNNGDNLLIQSGGNTVSNNFTTNPGFVSAGAGNFRLQSGSAAINAGQAISEIAADFEGISRPQGASYDIGAYEYSVGQIPSPGRIPSPSNFRIVKSR